MSDSTERLITCELCGFEFDASGLKCHTGCPMGTKCSLICCPNCGFQQVDEQRSVIARTVFRLWPAKEQEAPRPEVADAIPLTHVGKGMSVRVRAFPGMSESRLARLSAFGLVPGTEIVVKQRRPVPVIGIGETELALSDEILQQIWVSPAPDPGTASEVIA